MVRGMREVRGTLAALMELDRRLSCIKGRKILSVLCPDGSIARGPKRPVGCRLASRCGWWVGKYR